MGGISRLRRRTGELRSRIDEVGRIERTTTVVTLVAAGIAVAAVRAGAFDVPIRKKSLRFGVIHGWLRVLEEVALFQEPSEEVLSYPVVNRRQRCRVEVVAQPQAAK